jgi:hypothetical protein
VILARAAAIVVAMVRAASPLGAQAPSEPPQAEPSTEMMDVADLLRKLRHRPPPPPPDDETPDVMRAISPVIGAKHSAGVLFGVAGNVAFHRGDPASTHISSGVGSMTISTKSQTSVTVRLTMFGEDDAWRVETDDRFQWTFDRHADVSPGKGFEPATAGRWTASCGDSHWQKLSLDARTYLALSRTRRHKLAGWVFADLVTDGGAPYFDLPSTGSDTYGRAATWFQCASRVCLMRA